MVFQDAACGVLITKLGRAADKMAEGGWVDGKRVGEWTFWHENGALGTTGSYADGDANFDGEFNIANRGIVEFGEVLKLDVAFLYDLLGASQEHNIKPKKFAQTYIDEVIIGHTNEPEYKKLQANDLMEAFRDRTVKIDIPYVTRLEDEIKIYEKDYNEAKVRGKHIAPHTIEMAAMWAVLIAFIIGIGFTIWFKRYAKKVEDAGGKLTVTAIILKVVASALKVFPQFNASLDEAL